MTYELPVWSHFLGTVLLLTAIAPARPASAEDVFLAPSGVFPGQMWLSEGGTAPRIVHRREPQANPAFPRAIMKLGQIAVAPEGKVYFASGLDGSIMHLLDNRHEIQVMEFDGQIRDLACSSEEHTIYFSVVPTPQNGEPLADGKIYRRDLWAGRPTEVATVRQADVGGNWWGTFTIRGGVVYLATLDGPSRLYKLNGNTLERVFEQNVSAVKSLTAGPDGDFWFTTNDQQVYRTRDFVTVTSVLRGELNWNDVSLRQGQENPRP